MKKILLTLAAVSFLVGCTQNSAQTKNVDPLHDAYIPPAKNNVNIEKLSESIDHGLYRVTIDDTTQILLYRGVESCAMVKLK